MADAQIVLAYSRDTGIVAIGHGKQYKVANSVLRTSGFRCGDDGVYRLTAGEEDASRATVDDLVRHATAHGAEVAASSRRFIGDAARDIARLLPGQWDASIEIYSHPVWQEDLVPWLWDSGELAHAVQNVRIPYAATLTDTATKTSLLLVERPGHQLDYLVGAFAPETFQEGYGDPHAPRSMPLPPFAGRAARTIADRFLPAYESAVHARRIATVAEALDHIRAEHATWTAIVASGRYSDASPLSATGLGEASEKFLNRAWGEFRSVMQHAPALLEHCRPAATSWPEDARVLGQLADALTEAEGLEEDALLTRAERAAQRWAALDTWLTHSEPFLRQARAATPPRQHTVSAVAPPRQALQRGQHAPRR
ncbi:hypothetical protein [Streptomyces colonosanans]|uniref:Uncharacterized protein n=1 Tax=Streptomyces colonosanans TaxID=1428652 RepID=A0A1S2PCQ9_9ACTN|nr:hypothetical protein [Streptomyces colonosanans]OIJ91629.1 hypothetical protein BIV24_15310 [Streptomyces colonosanans]